MAYKIPESVLVVVYTRQLEVLLMQRADGGSWGNWGAWQSVTGSREPDDPDLEATARRELLEETGYAGGRWSPLMTLSANPALQNNLTYTFLAEGVERTAAPEPEASEDLRLHVTPVAEVQALLDEGEIVQALHAAPLAKYLLRRGSGR